jgi:hypothetical protein
VQFALAGLKQADEPRLLTASRTLELANRAILYVGLSLVKILSAFEINRMALVSHTPRFSGLLNTGFRPDRDSLTTWRATPSLRSSCLIPTSRCGSRARLSPSLYRCEGRDPAHREPAHGLRFCRISPVADSWFNLRVVSKH